MTLRWKRLLFVVFAVVFVYALISMAVIREVVMPAMASSNNGHLEGDAQYYHALASKQAQQIATKGLAAFELRPMGQGPAGIGSLLYLWWPSPYSFVVLNALLHALSTVVMVLILRCWFPWGTALVGALPLAISPYMMLWFSQLNKDSFAVSGVLLYVYALLRLLLREATLSWKSAAGVLLFALAGIGLLWVVRPYINQMLLPISLLSLALACTIWGRRGMRDMPAYLAVSAALLVCLTMAGKGAASDQTLGEFDRFSSPDATRINDEIWSKCFVAIDSQHWQNAPYLPEFANQKLKALAGQRCNIFTLLKSQTNPTTLSSFFDQSVLLHGSLDVVEYVPRAALFGVFSPLPDRWTYVFTHRTSIFYTITPIEALLMYSGLLGVLAWVWRGGPRSILIPFAIALPVMTIFAMATPLIGTLYRYRYAWWMLAICIGLGSMIEMSRHWRRNRVADTRGT
jgi:hypothetical protein